MLFLIMKNYIEINKNAWNNRVHVHLRSDFYKLDSFAGGESSLPALDIALLGDVRGKSILHLQCHFGMDTLSMARMGAKVTGVDFSDTAISKAKELSKELQVEACFVCCDVFNLPQVLNESFDIVYTSYGVISWLPDLQQWGKVVSAMLKPHGRFVMVEFHPILWMFDEDFKEITYQYSNKEPYVIEEPTYTDNGEETIDQTVTWNHGLSDVINGLANSGISIQKLDEYDYSPFNISPQMIETAPEKYQIKGLEGKIPMLFSILGEKYISG